MFHKAAITVDPHCPTANDDTIFVQLLNRFFRRLGLWIGFAPWTFITVTCLLTCFCSSIIPFTKLVNDVSDFTPLAARARSELKVYQNFFNREGEPIAVFVMVTAKHNGSMFGLSQLKEAVRIMDAVTNDINLENKVKNKSSPFSKFCSSFCGINEPIRLFYHGLSVLRDYNDSSSRLLDLAYPKATVLNREFYLDTNFFGVQVETLNASGKREVVSTKDIQSSDGRSILDDEKNQLRNNIKDVKVVVIQLRAEKPTDIDEEDVKEYEFAIVDYLKNNFSSPYVDAVVAAPSYLTAEIVRAGLTMLPCILIGFVTMCVFSVVTVSMSAVFMSQMNVQKLILALVACICPFMAVGTTLGGMFWLGVRFGSILCVTPFLVLAIGVDDSFLMIHSWQRLTKSLRTYPERDFRGNLVIIDVSERIGRTLEDIGPSITITTLTNVLAFGVGIFTPTPEIQLFCIGNALAMIIDFIYQISFFTAVMALLGKYEIEEEKRHLLCKNTFVDKKPGKHVGLHNLLKKVTKTYCDITVSIPSLFVVTVALFAYWAISIYGVMITRPELRPEMLFTLDSDMRTAINLRNTYITPYYSTCLVFVNKPGSIENLKNLQRLHKLVETFERLPRALGRFSTKLWIRDYEEFLESNDPGFGIDGENGTNSDTNLMSTDNNQQEFINFLKWPEFHHWNGTIQYHLDRRGKVVLDRFFFMTSSHGADLKTWSNRAALMRDWRKAADQFPELEVSVYEDDAKFLDILETLLPQTVQSSICTLVCMVLVCLLFISQKSATAIATFSILSTCLGVFGLLTLWGADLDPIVMSAIIMSIGFSVDIPAHVVYHFYKAEGVSINDRLERCLSAIAFPVLQASLSTMVCVLSILWVQIHMGIVFVKTVVLVVTIGLIHGLLVIPVLIKILSLLFGRFQLIRPTSSDVSTYSAAHVIKINYDAKY